MSPANEKKAVTAAATEPAWVTERDAATNTALANHDGAALAKLAALPGGFGSSSSRRRAWVELLHIDQLALPDVLREPTPDTDTDTDTDGVAVYPPHEDEGQVLLDTRRSFVAYPKGLSSRDKAAMQEDLQALIVAVLQRHPKLGYFQGLHDIMTVLYLTLLDDVPRPRGGGGENGGGNGDTDEQRRDWTELVRAAEVVMLCRTRDAMGKGLRPMMGMLKLLRRLLAAADPQLYRISASISPVPTLPFFALSWILTLFSHDVDTLEPVQRIFDYLISRNPISAIYLAVAILMAKKPQMLKLAAALGPEARHDPSLLHPLFSRLPPLYPDTPDAPVPPKDYTSSEPPPRDEPNPYTPIVLSRVFALAERLQEKYPWDGPRIRGYEVLGPGSVVYTYAKEGGGRVDGDAVLDADNEKQQVWTLEDAEAAIDADVILPDGDAMDDDTDLVVARWSPLGALGGLPLGRLLGLRLSAGSGVLGWERLGTAVALGVVVLGIGAALFGWRRHQLGVGINGGVGHDPATLFHAQWARFWAMVAGQWVVKRGSAVGTYVAGLREL